MVLHHLFVFVCKKLLPAVDEWLTIGSIKGSVSDA